MPRGLEGVASLLGGRGVCGLAKLRPVASIPTFWAGRNQAERKWRPTLMLLLRCPCSPFWASPHIPRENPIARYSSCRLDGSGLFKLPAGKNSWRGCSSRTARSRRRWVGGAQGRLPEQGSPEPVHSLAVHPSPGTVALPCSGPCTYAHEVPSYLQSTFSHTFYGVCLL